MPARLTLHPPDRAARYLVLREGEALLVGRAPDCGLVIDDPCVSKRHAWLRPSSSGWSLEDAGSKNGTTVNGAAAAGTELADGDWISFGGVLARFEVVSEAMARDLEGERLARLQTVAGLRRELSAGLDPVDLLLRFLQCGVQLVSARRGFVLLAGPDGELQVEVATGSAGAAPAAAAPFAGSRGALERALQSRAPVVLSDASADPSLGRRPSVAAAGIGALACIPVQDDGRLIGALYVDGPERGPAFTELDVEVLQALGDHVAIAVGSLRIERSLREAAARCAPPASTATS